MAKYDYDICVVGGLGHVGLPLSIAFASKGMKVCAYDISKDVHAIVSKGKMPFIEYGAQPLLEKTLKDGTLTLSQSEDSINKAEIVIIVIGTPVDSHMAPVSVVEDLVEKHIKHFRNGQLLVLRSTVYPGTTDRIYRILKSHNLKMDVAFCPERIVQGYAIKELFELPQIVSATTKSGERRASRLFKLLTNDIIVAQTLEAEMGKLFTNSWRYIRFSVANQFFMICNDMGVDFYKVYDIITRKYPRGQDLPKAGFTAGPCLFKDTVQLNAFYNHNFTIGNSALLINEGLPLYLINRLRKSHDLSKKTVGILGMAFKEGIDDKRDSLSYKLNALLKLEAKKTYCSDVYIDEPGFVSAEDLVKKSDIIIVATPHKEYAKLKIGKDKTVVDIWNLFGNGGKV